MNFTFLDFIFLIGIILVIFPVLVYNWMIGCVVCGLTLVFLSLQAGKHRDNGG